MLTQRQKYVVRKLNPLIKEFLGKGYTEEFITNALTITLEVGYINGIVKMETFTLKDESGLRVQYLNEHRYYLIP